MVGGCSKNSWGNSSYGELGHGSSGTVTSPQKVEALEGLPIRALSMGNCHSSVLLASGEAPLAPEAFKTCTWVMGGGNVAVIAPPGVALSDVKDNESLQQVDVVCFILGCFTLENLLMSGFVCASTR